MRVSRLMTGRRLFILLGSIIVVMVVAGLTMSSSNRQTSWPARIIMDVQNTVGGWIYKPVSRVTGFIDGISQLHEMYVENAELKQEMQNYASLKAQLAEADAENQRLSQMVGFKKSQGTHYQLVPSRVIGRDPSTWNSEITIDVGTASGVKVNMPVVSVDGSLVGRISAAAAYSSKVILITDTQVGDGVSAKVLTGSTQQPFGIVVGSSTSPGSLQMNFLSPLANISVGQTVITSHLGGIFPDGLVIGRITKVTTGAQGLTQLALIQPAADLTYVQDVFVVKSSS